jgi:hypothetical protein
MSEVSLSVQGGHCTETILKYIGSANPQHPDSIHRAFSIIASCLRQKLPQERRILLQELSSKQRHPLDFRGVQHLEPRLELSGTRRSMLPGVGARRQPDSQVRQFDQFERR